MKAIVVYDSLYGNTEQIAQAIGKGAGADKVLRVGQAGPADLEALELLIIGSPTQGAKATPAVQAFIDGMAAGSLKDTGIAAFDTRISVKTGHLGTRLIAGMAGGFGYAAKRIAEALEAKGGRLAAPAEGFIVTGTKGPLKEGEAERAAEWARQIVSAVESK